MYLRADQILQAHIASHPHVDGAFQLIQHDAEQPDRHLPGST